MPNQPFHLARPKPSKAMEIIHSLRAAANGHLPSCLGGACGVSIFDLRRAAQIVAEKVREDEKGDAARVLDNWF
jgi:hypothetical protein